MSAPTPPVPHTIEVGGLQRRLLVAAPTGTPTAIVLSLHGSSSTPERQVRLSRMAPLAERGALVAFPQGSIPSRAGWEWELDDDVRFLDAVIEYLCETFGATARPVNVRSVVAKNWAWQSGHVSRTPPWKRDLFPTAGLRPLEFSELLAQGASTKPAPLRPSSVGQVSA